MGRLFVFSVPFDPIPLFSGRTLAFPLGVLLVVTVTADYFAGRRAGALPTSFGAILAVYLGWVTFTVFWSYDPAASLGTATQLLVRGVFVLALAFLIPSLWDRLATAFVWGAFVLAVLLLAQGEQEYVGRLTYMSADENAIGLSLVVGFGICLAKVTEENLRGTAVYLALASVLAVATIATGSRTGLIALVVALMVRLVSGKQLKRTVQTSVIVGTIFAGTWYLLTTQRVPDRVVSFLKGSSIRDESRTNIMDAFYRNPDWMLFGTGVQADATFLRLKTGVFAYVHNLYLGAWVQLGIIGAVVLILLLLVAARLGWQSNRRDVWISAIAPMFVYSLTLGGQTSNVYWFVIVLGVARFGKPATKSFAKRHEGIKRESVG